MFENILCPTDFETPSAQAVDAAIEMAKAFGGSVTLVHVFDAPVYAQSGVPFAPVVDMGPTVERAARSALDAAVLDAKRRLPRVSGILRRGRPWEEILIAAKEARSDLIVMATHGRRGLPRAVLGSVAEKVVRLSPIPVLTVRGPSSD